jgi:hypothetical protein
VANPEHLGKVREGVEAWNQWRKQRQEVEPERGAELRGELSGVNFREVDLSPGGPQGCEPTRRRPQRGLPLQGKPDRGE